MAILHVASVISAIVPVKIGDVQGPIGVKGHPSRWADDLTPTFPANRRIGLAHVLARQRYVSFPRHNKHGVERIYGSANCNKVSCKPLPRTRDDKSSRLSKLTFIERQVYKLEEVSAGREDREDLKFVGESSRRLHHGRSEKYKIERSKRVSLTNINTKLDISSEPFVDNSFIPRNGCLCYPMGELTALRNSTSATRLTCAEMKLPQLASFMTGVRLYVFPM